MWAAGGRLSSGWYDEALRIDVLGQEGLALGVSGCLPASARRGGVDSGMAPARWPWPFR